ncbi:MAG: response regulator [Desulfovibrio sp.]|jgi:signal transduction histidine kinase/ActR/RegA family two-component response regulator|nr:response regulator [Desulfovibrio sp.]
MANIKAFFSSLRGKALLVILLVMNIPFWLTAHLANTEVRGMLLQEKEAKLMSLARVLDNDLDPGGFTALLRKNGAENASREEKIRILNQELREITDSVSSTSPGNGIGYYSLELDAILTYGPSETFGNMVGRTIAPTHPGREVMRTGKPMCTFGSMVRGNILNAMYPIIREGRTIGYIWSNELSTDVEKQFNDTAKRIIFLMVFCALLSVVLLVLLSRRLITDIDNIISGVRTLRFDLAKRIKEPKGELKQVVQSINAMAADLDRANQETRRAISVLRSVMSNMEAIIHVCDPHTYRLLYANDHMIRLLNCRDYENKFCHKVIYGSDEPCADCPIEGLLAGRGRGKTDAVRWERHNEVIGRDFLMFSRLITWHDGSVLHMEVGTDVTQRNALALAEAANQAQRNFLARMSHELRTPMNGVLGMTRLAMQADPPKAQMEYLKKIQSSAALLLGIINDILDFSKIEAGKLEIENHRFKIQEIVENIRELVMPRIAEKDLRFIVEIDDSVPVYATGDGLRLSQVLLNLIGNAAKFTMQGEISLTMNAKHQADGRVRLNCTVQDTGIGMSSEQQETLFKPFSQADASTSRRFGGTGLGLSICKALVELMGGAISVSSQPGAGSVFSFFVELEAAGDMPEQAEEKEKSWENIRFDGKKFLLVEDNAINQEIALAILEELGATVDVADNGEDGLNAFLANDYHLVLMDVRMPVMDGLEATRRIRASDKADAASVPIIAMTANAMREDREASKDAGMNGHIAKPIDVNELKSVLAAHAGEKDGQEE